MLRMLKAFFLKDIKVFLSYKFNLITTAITVIFLTVFIEVAHKWQQRLRVNATVGKETWAFFRGYRTS